MFKESNYFNMTASKEGEFLFLHIIKVKQLSSKIIKHFNDNLGRCDRQKIWWEEESEIHYNGR